MQTKENKRKDAIARNLTWNQLKLSQKIDELKRRPGNCVKQLAKLHKD